MRKRALETDLAERGSLQPITARDLEQIQPDVKARPADWQGVLRRQIASQDATHAVGSGRRVCQEVARS